jgi:hypothetical protein
MIYKIETLRMLNMVSITSISIILVIVVSISLALPESLDGITGTAFASRSSQGFVLPGLGLVDLGEFRKAPVAISGDNIYIAWPNNKTGNDEVMFRASIDGGVTFTDKVNLSNSTIAESQDVEISADSDRIILTWWERNQTAQEPVMRISSDNGQTFGPLLRLATNGTIGEAGGEG